MLDLVEVFNNIGPALQVIFRVGIEPKEEEFYIPTNEHYEKIKKQEIDI